MSVVSNQKMHTGAPPLQREEWEDKGSYWHYAVEQGTKIWLKSRVGRCTGTTNDGESFFGESKEEMAEYITGVKSKTFSKEAMRRMNIGTEDEPKARDWYQNTYQLEVEELGFCIPKFNLNIGASVDGKLKGHNGIVEIKCPGYMYMSLKKYIETYPRPSGNSHIKPYHFKQMQFNMGCVGADFCDYIVFSRCGRRFVQRVVFDEQFWKAMYSRTVKFWNDYVRPIVEDKKINMVMPPINKLTVH